jgi:hypothetical protein
VTRTNAFESRVIAGFVRRLSVHDIQGVRSEGAAGAMRTDGFVPRWS